MMEFQEFAKIPRYRREVCLTEGMVLCRRYKDSTCKRCAYEQSLERGHQNSSRPARLVGITCLRSPRSGSSPRKKSRVKAKNDNYGFATWVDANADDNETRARRPLRRVVGAASSVATDP
jgi:hypothetical protein